MNRSACPARQLALLAGAVFLIAFGSRCWTIAAFGTDLPFWDQWDGEARDVFLPWFAHHLSWHDLASPHNEHRIVLTRLIDLGLLAVNGQWDARLETVVGALIQSTLGGLLVGWTAREFSVRAALGFAAAAAAVFALPYAYENTLGGFQIQMFLLLALSAGALRFLVTAEPLTARSWAGVTLAALSLGTMASGLFAAAAAIPVLVWAEWPRRDFRRAALGAMLVGIVAIGFGTRYHVLSHTALAAHSLAEFLRSLLRLAAWPRWRTPWTAVIYPLPWLALMAATLRQRSAPTPQIKWLAALGIWTGLQIAAIAYARKPYPFPAPRYLDVLLLWILVNAAAAFVLGQMPRGPRARRGITAALGLWAAFVVIAYVPVTHKDLRPELRRWRDDSRAYEQSVHAYLASGNPAALEGKIPYPDAGRLQAVLDQTAIRRILPSSVADPAVPMAGLSRAALDTARAGPWILGLGIVAFAAACLGAGRSAASPRSG
jgi:hypothetical protein